VAQGKKIEIVDMVRIACDIPSLKVKDLVLFCFVLSFSSFLNQHGTVSRESIGASR